MMWRTSWLSREVIVAPTFIGCVLWLFAESNERSSAVFPLGAIALALCYGYAPQ